MRFDFSRLLLEIERRAKWIHAMRVATRFLSVASAITLLAALGLRLSTLDVGWHWAIVLLGLPWVVTIGAYAVGHAKSPNLARQLLRLDDALGTDARMSSLYEIRRRGHRSIFRDRLEIAVQGIAADWKRGLPLPRQVRGTAVAGMVGLGISCLLVLLPMAAPSAASSLPVAREGMSQADRNSGATADSSPDQAPVRPDGLEAPVVVSQEDVSPTPERVSDTSTVDENAELTLDSVLDDLGSSPQGNVQVDAAPSADEISDMASEQEQARQALSDMLQDLHEQMQGNPRPLTQQESRILQSLATQTGDREIQNRSDEIVNEPNPAQIDEKLQDLLDQLDPDSTSSDESEGNGEDSSAGRPETTEVTGDQEAGQRFLDRTAQALDEQSAANPSEDNGAQPGTQPETDPEAQEPSGENPSTRVAGNPEDLAETGGESGMPGATGDQAPTEEVGFVQEEAPTAIGEQGEFVDEFVTKGVPVEIEETGPAAGTHLVDFEQMESILRERGLPDEALGSVRRYFELITQPEGGS